MQRLATRDSSSTCEGMADPRRGPMMSSCRLCLSMSCSCTTPAPNANSKICCRDCHAGCRIHADCQHAGLVLRRHIAERPCSHTEMPPRLLLVSFAGRLHSIPQRALHREARINRASSECTFPGIAGGLPHIRDVLSQRQAHVAHVGGVVMLACMHKHAPRGRLQRAVDCEHAREALPASAL